MIDPEMLEKAYADFSQNLKTWAPDGIIPVDLHLLKDLDLLDIQKLDEGSPEEVTEQFNVIETDEKITLYNDQFAIWIVPKIIEGKPTTYVYISRLVQEGPRFELVFSTTGVYNTPQYILRVMQHFLLEVIDNEKMISSIGKKP